MNRWLRALLPPAIVALGLPVALFVAPAVAVAGDPCFHGYDMPARTVATTATVRALPCAFTPTVAYVPVGTTVTFGNATQDVHLITGANQEWGDREAELLGNATVSYTFDQAGVFPYACALHRGMVGAIVVGADGAAGLAPQTGGAAPATAASTLRASGASGSEPALAVVAAIGAVVALGAVALVARARHRATGPGSAAAPDGATR